MENKRGNLFARVTSRDNPTTRCGNVSISPLSGLVTRGCIVRVSLHMWRFKGKISFAFIKDGRMA